jgi:tRNA(Ile)-lysidine synthase TilS/MesJ
MEPIEYAGDDKLLDDILKHKRKDYNCVIGFNGGRDSSYLLWDMARKLKLRVVAYCLHNGLIPSETKQTISRLP